MYFDQMLVFDEWSLSRSPAATAVAGVAPLFDFDEQHFERQPLVREHAREVDELVEHIEERSLLRAAAAGNDFAPFAVQLHEMLGHDDRFDDEHVVLFQKRCDFVADRRERGELDFDELLAADDVDAVAAEALFDECACGGVVLFQLAVEGSFHTSLMNRRRFAGG